MNVGDLFERLSYGELSNLTIGMEGAGAVSVDGQPRIVGFANKALTLLHSRFTQRIDEAVIEMREGVQRYVLASRFAVSHTTPPHSEAYLLDTPGDPFEDNVVRILSIEEIGLPADNPDILPVTARAMAHNTVFVRDPRPGGLLRVEYQANHPRLVLPVDLDQPISLAPVLEEALETRVAAAVYSAMNGEGHRDKARELLMRYEEICQTVEQESLLEETATTGRLWVRDRGFI